MPQQLHYCLDKDPTSHTEQGRLLSRKTMQNQWLEVPGNPDNHFTSLPFVAFSMSRHHHSYLDHFSAFPFQVSITNPSRLFLNEGSQNEAMDAAPAEALTQVGLVDPGWVDSERFIYARFKPRLPQLLQRKQGNDQHKILVLVWCWTFEKTVM